MPGWHAATSDLWESGDIEVVGIVIEQHPDRARLFMQWKQMGWPLLVDALDRIDMPLVPATLLLDEHGVVRHVQSIGYDKVDPRQAVEAHLAATWEAPPQPRAAAPDVEALRAAEDWLGLGDALFEWGPVDGAIAAFEQATQVDPESGAAWFRLGVALRARYDSPDRHDGDFQAAVDAWSRALDIDPNNYIWRRRIQQFGPRLPKPYPFYDWIDEARADIRARGETPVPLVAEPTGAETASPEATFTPDAGATEPDPEGRIHRDDGTFVQVETVAVPSRVAPGETARVHVVLRPNLARKAHWNNEAEDTLVWLGGPFDTSERLHAVGRPPEVVSTEARRVEAEVRVPDDASPGAVALPGHALVYVCEDVDGTCLYRRRDFTVSLVVAPPENR